MTFEEGCGKIKNIISIGEKEREQAMLTWGMILYAVRMMANEITLERCADDLGISVSTLQRWAGGSLLHAEGIPKGLTSQQVKIVIDLYKEDVFGRDEEKTIHRFLAELEKQNVDVKKYREIYREYGYERTLNEIIYPVTVRKITKSKQGRLIGPEDNDEKKTVRKTAPAPGRREAVEWNSPINRIAGGAAVSSQRINAGAGHLVLESIPLTIHVPDVPFPVEYYLRHVQNGKNEFLPVNDRLPLNMDYKFEKSAERGEYSVTVPYATRRQGFQFKCYAICDEQNADALVEALKKYLPYDRAPFKGNVAMDSLCYMDSNGHAFPLVEVSGLDPRIVWFLLPNYSVYITHDPFINNYYYV